MIPLEEALGYVVDRVGPLVARPLALDEALGAVLAERVTADEPVPPFANTAMDGYAVRAVDTAGAPVRLEVVGALAAGDASTREIGPGEAVRIMTGAPLPPGADAVVMVEHTRPVAVGEGPGGAPGGRVEIAEPVLEGQHVRPAGDDLRAGQTVFEPGEVLDAGHLGVLATLGRTAVTCHPRPVVGVLSTGDELVEGPGRLAPGQVRDANRRTLIALLGRAGCDAVDLGIAPDDQDAIAERVQGGVDACDAVLTSGGVSVGDYDHVEAVLERLGEMRWMQVAIKPAKPFAFGLVAGTPVFGLPGNPVSSMVSFELLARPALRRMAGRPPHRRRLRAVVDGPLTRTPDGKVHFARVQLAWGDDGRLHVTSAGGQGSHMLWAMARADALAVLPDGDGAAAGEEVEVVVLRWE